MDVATPCRCPDNMAVKLVFLGRLADIAGAERQAPIGSLADILAGLDEDLAQAVADPRIRIAINGTLLATRDDVAVRDGDEVAFLPPVSGG